MDINNDAYFCSTTADIWQVIGYILFAVKVVIPLIIIILGIFDFFKAVTSSEDAAIAKAGKSLVMRLVIGLAVYFIPLIISVIFSFVSSASTFIARGEACQQCLLRPLTENCQNYKTIAQEYRQAQKEGLSEGNDYRYEAMHCYFAYNNGDKNGVYIWGFSGTKKYKNVSIAEKYTTKEACLNKSNPTNINNYIMDPSDGDSGNYDQIIYLGDSQMNGVCTNNNLSNCYTCVGGGLDWFNGSTSRCANADATSTVQSDVSGKLSGGNAKIIINLGTNDLLGGASTAASNLLNSYKSLLNGSWKNAKIVVTSILPLRSDSLNLNGYIYKQAYVNTFNNTMRSQISTYKNKQIVYCDLGFTSSDLASDYGTDGLHFGPSGYQKIYKAIQEKCEKL